MCAALARYENTLRDAIREIHVDVRTFQLGVERRLEETVSLSRPLGQAVAELQQENQQLRSQLDALSRQVELLGGVACERNAFLSHQNLKNHPNHIQEREEIREVVYGRGQAHFSLQSLGNQMSPRASFFSSPCLSSPPAQVSEPVSSSSPTAARFSSRATFAVSSKTNVSTAPSTSDICL